MYRQNKLTLKVTEDKILILKETGNHTGDCRTTIAISCYCASSIAPEKTPSTLGTNDSRKISMLKTRSTFTLIS